MVEQAVDKDKKYDRQIRIWGKHGQAALESARLCLLNCGPTGSETLKNMVLGGIASFTVVDGTKVAAHDLGNNFLLDKNSLGQSKAQCVTEFLKELNDTVQGSFVDEDPEELMVNNPKFFRSFDLVVATQLRESAVVKLEAVCRSLDVKLIVARAYGLMGLLRASLKEHHVVESKPDNAVLDLRLHKPWTELEQLALSIDLDSMDEPEHKHVPYALVLIQVAAKWCAEHGGQLPKAYAERTEFKKLLRSFEREKIPGTGVLLEEENFEEAHANAHKLWAPPGIPSEVAAIFADEAANAQQGVDDFWILVAAVKRFVENEGEGDLPLEGSVPDMTATTAMYLQLQRVYRDKAERDLAAVEAHVARVLQAVGRPPKSIPRATIKTFVKNVRNIRVVRFRKIAAEVGSETVKADVLRQALAAEDQASNAALYVLLRAVDGFYAQHKRYPGTSFGDLEEDLPALKTLATALLSKCGIGNASIPDDLVAEMCRFGAGELHNVAAVVGGMAAQEAIKLITKQFVPQPGTIIYNGMHSTMSVFVQ